MSEFEIISKCERREALKAEIEKMEEEVKRIEKDLKTLDQQDEPYRFGPFKVFWKSTTKTEHSWEYIKEHEPMAYKKAEVVKPSTYFMIKR